MLDGIDIFGEGSPPGHPVAVDLLAGRVLTGRRNGSLDRRLDEARVMLERLCTEAGGSVAELQIARADLRAGTMAITIRDERGRSSTVDYDRDGARVRMMDALGRLRVRPPYRRPLE